LQVRSTPLKGQCRLLFQPRGKRSTEPVHTSISFQQGRSAAAQLEATESAGGLDDY
jgi:hypothetical protein